MGVFALIWLRTAIVSLEYELTTLQNQKAELMREEKLMAAEKANVYSIEKIEKVAIKRLGMKLPERDKIVFVKKITGAGPYKVSSRSFSRNE
jgi:cell division protein FtsL